MVSSDCDSTVDVPLPLTTDLHFLPSRKEQIHKAVQGAKAKGKITACVLPKGVAAVGGTLNFAFISSF